MRLWLPLALSYTGLTGRSMTVLGALNQYGLVEVTAKGQTRVTQTAEDILIGFPEEVKRAAISKAARTPTLFREIYDKYGTDIPGDNAIRSFLFSRGFTNDGVEKALKSFNATNRHAEIYGDSESYGEETESGTESEPQEQSEASTMQATTAPSAEPKSGVTFFKAGPLDYNLSSSGLALTGKTASAAELRAFIERLKALAPLLPEGAETEDPDDL